jgi:hypothetical protein
MPRSQTTPLVLKAVPRQLLRLRVEAGNKPLKLA